MTYYYKIADDGSSMDIYEDNVEFTGLIKTIENDGSGFHIPPDIKQTMQNVISDERRFGLSERGEYILEDLSNENIVDLNKAKKTVSDLEWNPTLSEAQQFRIDEIKSTAKRVLGQTDWYIIREQDMGEAIPQDVLNHRTEVRSLSDEFESEVNNLKAVKDVLNYEYSFPSPPKK